MDMELQRFKNEIRVDEYLAGCGAELDAAKSTRTNPVFRTRGLGKIVVTDGGHRWFRPGDERGGDIIDLDQTLHGGTLGDVRKRLRERLGGRKTRPAFPSPQALPVAAHKDLGADGENDSAEKWKRCSRLPRGGHPYLDERGITGQVLNDIRFIDCVRRDPRHGNVVFPYSNLHGVVAVELRNRNWKRFRAGGKRGQGLWASSNLSGADEIVITETPIDALSHAQLYPARNSAYVATGGTIARAQRETLLPRIARGCAERGAVLIAGQDADGGGDSQAETVRFIAGAAGCLFNRERPPCEGADWNDILVEN